MRAPCFAVRRWNKQNATKPRVKRCDYDKSDCDKDRFVMYLIVGKIHDEVFNDVNNNNNNNNIFKFNLLNLLINLLMVYEILKYSALL